MVSKYSFLSSNQVSMFSATVLFWEFFKVASLVTQLVKNLPAMQETWVQSLGWEDTVEKGKAIHSSILT